MSRISLGATSVFWLLSSIFLLQLQPSQASFRSIHAVTLDDGTISLVSACPGIADGQGRLGLCVSSCPKGICSSTNAVQALTQLNEKVEDSLMTLSSTGKIILAFRANCNGKSPCLGLCQDPACETIEGASLEPLENPSKLNHQGYSIPGYALSIALNSNDQPAVSYLRLYREDSKSDPIIMWQVALCNHSRCDSFEVKNIANFTTEHINDIELVSTIAAFDGNDGLHVALAFNSSVVIYRCLQAYLCTSWQQTNIINLPGPISSLSLLPSSSGPGQERTLVFVLESGVSQAMQCADDFITCSIAGIVDAPHHVIAQDISLSTELTIDKDGDAVKMLATAVASFNTGNVSSVTLVACADKTCYFNVTRSVVWSHLYSHRDREHHPEIETLLPEVAVTTQLDSPRPFIAIRTPVDGTLRAILCQSISCDIFSSVIIADNGTRILHSQSQLQPSGKRPLDWAILGPIIGISSIILIVALIYWVGRMLKRQARLKMRDANKTEHRRKLTEHRRNSYGSIGPAPPLLGSMNASSEDYDQSETTTDESDAVYQTMVRASSSIN